MYELSKVILEKVSFDRKLFHKELLKASNWIKPDEKTLLKMWCLSVFGNKYQEEIMEVFKNVT
jgi:hypothetical protein